MHGEKKIYAKYKGKKRRRETIFKHLVADENELL